VKKSEDSIWTRPLYGSWAGAADSLAHEPSGGRVKKWLLGGGLAALPIIYGVRCLETGHTTLVGRGGDLSFTGDTGFWLAVAYIAIGAFIHFHYFWGLSPRLWPLSQAGKVLSLVVFLPCFFYALHRSLL
jgi:hypothetical protein